MVKEVEKGETLAKELAARKALKEKQKREAKRKAPCLCPVFVYLRMDYSSYALLVGTPL